MKPTQVCILGCHHLDERTPRGATDGIVERVVAWAPDAIALELLPPQQSFLDQQLDEEDWSENTLFSAREPREGWAAVQGLHAWTFPQAHAAALDPATPADQRVIAWLAAFEPYTAALQAEGVDLPAPAREFLDDLTSRPNERATVGYRAARALHHRQLWHFDDFTDDSMEAEDWSALTQCLLPVLAPTLEQIDREQDEAAASGDLWAEWLRLASDEGTARLEYVNCASHVAPEAEPIEAVARKRVAQWRGRNLHMAGNLRQVTGQFPGGRVLVLVGGGHARPLRTALATDQHDIELVDVAALV